MNLVAFTAQSSATKLENKVSMLEKNGIVDYNMHVVVLDDHRNLSILSDNTQSNKHRSTYPIRHHDQLNDANSSVQHCVPKRYLFTHRCRCERLKFMHP